jgi:hypothetical protein
MDPGQLPAARTVAHPRQSVNNLSRQYNLPGDLSQKLWAYYKEQRIIHNLPDFPERYVQSSNEWRWEQFVLDELMYVLSSVYIEPRRLKSNIPRREEFKIDTFCPEMCWEEIRKITHRLLTVRKHAAVKAIRVMQGDCIRDT